MGPKGVWIELPMPQLAIELQDSDDFCTTIIHRIDTQIGPSVAGHDGSAVVFSDFANGMDYLEQSERHPLPRKQFANALEDLHKRGHRFRFLIVGDDMDNEIAKLSEFCSVIDLTNAEHCGAPEEQWVTLRPELAKGGIDERRFPNAVNEETKFFLRFAAGPVWFLEMLANVCCAPRYMKRMNDLGFDLFVNECGDSLLESMEKRIIRDTPELGNLSPLEAGQLIRRLENNKSMRNLTDAQAKVCQKFSLPGFKQADASKSPLKPLIDRLPQRIPVLVLRCLQRRAGFSSTQCKTLLRLLAPSTDVQTSCGKRYEAAMAFERSLRGPGTLDSYDVANHDLYGQTSSAVQYVIAKNFSVPKDVILKGNTEQKHNQRLSSRATEIKRATSERATTRALRTVVANERMRMRLCVRPRESSRSASRSSALRDSPNLGGQSTTRVGTDQSDVDMSPPSALPQKETGLLLSSDLSFLPMPEEYRVMEDPESYTAIDAMFMAIREGKTGDVPVCDCRQFTLEKGQCTQKCLDFMEKSRLTYSDIARNEANVREQVEVLVQEIEGTTSSDRVRVDPNSYCARDVPKPPHFRSTFMCPCGTRKKDQSTSEESSSERDRQPRQKTQREQLPRKWSADDINQSLDVNQVTEELVDEDHPMHTYGCPGVLYKELDGASAVNHWRSYLSEQQIWNTPFHHAVRVFGENQSFEPLYYRIAKEFRRERTDARVPEMLYAQHWIESNRLRPACLIGIENAQDLKDRGYTGNPRTADIVAQCIAAYVKESNIKFSGPIITHPQLIKGLRLVDASKWDIRTARNHLARDREKRDRQRTTANSDSGSDEEGEVDDNREGQISNLMEAALDANFLRTAGFTCRAKAMLFAMSSARATGFSDVFKRAEMSEDS